jgi:tRNA dimethylallyltransferase
MSADAAERGAVLVVSGTTASGKDRTGALLAARLGGEVISLDSMKVYRGMDVGTDKPRPEEREGVPHHLVDILEPAESMNLRRYVDLAHQARRDIAARGRLPVVVGGTALYLTGFLRGVFEGPAADAAFRERLRREAAAGGTEVLHARLAQRDPAAAARIHPRDYKRIERALEVLELTGSPISALQKQWSEPAPFRYRLYLLTWAREVLDARIDERVDRMIEGGLVDEVRRILASGGFGPQSGEALGYREIAAFLRGETGLEEARELIKRRTRRFARRQLTWFRGMKEAVWITGAEDDGPQRFAARIEADFHAFGGASV